MRFAHLSAHFAMWPNKVGSAVFSADRKVDQGCRSLVGWTRERALDWALETADDLIIQPIHWLVAPGRVSRVSNHFSPHRPAYYVHTCLGHLRAVGNYNSNHECRGLAGGVGEEWSESVKDKPTTSNIE